MPKAKRQANKPNIEKGIEGAYASRTIRSDAWWWNWSEANHRTVGIEIEVSEHGEVFVAVETRGGKVGEIAHDSRETFTVATVLDFDLLIDALVAAREKGRKAGAL